MLRDVFGFPENQEKPTYSLGCKLKLTRVNNNAVLCKVPEIANAKTVISEID